MAKIHVLADETLGGIKREYVEVNRRAEVGESVYTIISEEFRKVTRVEGVGAYLDDGGLVFHENYRVLEPTDIVHIEGSRYKLIDRKAEVGERVIIVNGGHNCPFDNGKITEVIVSREGFVSVKPVAHLYHPEYRVLEPVETEKEATSPQSTDDIIANLARRVSSLERQVTELECENKAMLDVYERGQKWTHARINGVKDDIESWAQDVEKVRVTAKYAEAKVHKVIRDVDDLAGEVRQVDDKIEMCIDDIVTLDERTSTTEECTEHVNTRRCCGCQSR